jgi:c-di-GMP-binding flagellar brake protein YcgR
VNLRVLDISIGGCSLLLPQNLPRLESGTHLKGSRVDLGAGVRFTADLLVRSLRPTTADPDCRVGCEWQSVDGAAQRTLQRFIDDAQRRWRSAASC